MPSHIWGLLSFLLRGWKFRVFMYQCHSGLWSLVFGEYTKLKGEYMHVFEITRVING